MVMVVLHVDTGEAIAQPTFELTAWLCNADQLRGGSASCRFLIYRWAEAHWDVLASSLVRCFHL